MLVLSRKKNESIVINGNIRIEVLQIKGKQIRLGITAPSNLKVLRGELPACSPPATQTEQELVFEATLPFEVMSTENNQNKASSTKNRRHESKNEQKKPRNPELRPMSPTAHDGNSNRALHNLVSAVMATN